MARPKKDEKDKGIPHWTEKRKALQDLFGAYSLNDLATAILNEPNSRTDYSAVAGLADMLRNYHRMDPSGSIGTRMLNSLPKQIRNKWREEGRELTLGDATIRTLIRRGSYEQFLEGLIPGAASATVGLDHRLPADAAGSGHSTIATHISPMAPSNALHVSLPQVPHDFINSIGDAMRTALRVGRVDQRFHYLTPEAEENWRDVVNSGFYKQYDECKLALKKFLEQDLWRNFFRDRADGCVMLGCGAGTKDDLIVTSMIECANTDRMLHYKLVDVSPYMLTAAYYRINRYMRKRGINERVQVKGHQYDFVDGFAGKGSELRRNDANVAWFLPGGTLGNLDEDRFFKSLAAESAVGDFLVVGVETVGCGETTEDVGALTRKYDTPEVRQFVEMPLRSLLRAADITGQPPTIDVRVVPARGNPHSKVPGSVTVEVSTAINRKEIVLLTSTRYNENDLVPFADQRQFEHVETVISPMSARYKQFIFRRK